MPTCVKQWRCAWARPGHLGHPFKVCNGSKADLTLGATDVGSHLNNGHGVRTSDVMAEIGQRPTCQRHAPRGSRRKFESAVNYI